MFFIFGVSLGQNFQKTILNLTTWYFFLFLIFTPHVSHSKPTCDQSLAKNWVLNILDEHQIKKNSKAGNKVIYLKLLPKNVCFYHLLQKEIALLIPNEPNRPTINLEIANNFNQDQVNIVGIVGGVGPLADAELLNEIFILISKDLNFSFDHLKVHLLSSPPPRSFLGWASLKLRGVKYLNRMAHFLRSGYDYYFIASNTAHLNYYFINQLVKNHTLKNLVEHTALEIKDKMLDGSSVLILGTYSTHKKKLYQNIFTKIGFIPRSHTKFEPNEDDRLKQDKNYYYEELSSDESALKLQYFINEIKKGNVATIQNDFTQFILKEYLQIHQLNPNQPIQHILLACTELPLALKESLHMITKEIEEKTGIKVAFHNTQEIFAKHIFNYMKTLN